MVAEKQHFFPRLEIDPSNMVTRTVDLRSDTVTKPCEGMRAVMAKAEVDDDVLGNDPTALRLETEMARIMGKEAALFVPSGTMGNLISVLVHCNIRGSEVILGDNSHIHIYENGGIATIGGVHPRTVKNNNDGTMDLDKIEAKIRDPRGELVYPITRLICLENSHANTGGRCLSVEYTDQVGELAKKHGLKLHIDGARIFNAAASLGVAVDRLVQAADSVSVCLSKGIGAPVGSVIVGSEIFIARARILRKTLGGGMRQIGILCSAALFAVQHNVAKLESDHKNAKALAVGLNDIKGLKVNVAAVETNIVYVDLEESSNLTAEKLYKNLQQHGVVVMLEGPYSIRIVIHHQISESDVQYTLSCFKQVLNADDDVHCENDAVFVNGKVCKNPSLATIDDFTYSGLNVPGDTRNKNGGKITIVDTTVIPGMNTLGINLVRIDLAANGGLNPPHEHPRTSEVLFVAEGTMYAGFVTTNPERRLFAKVLHVGDVIVFPVGMIHFQYNIGRTPALAFAALGSQNPGIMTIGNSMFGSDPPINVAMLAKAFQLEEKVVRELQRKTWVNPEGDNELTEDYDEL
ncbi:Low-specificity L-threonine aldolase 1 [Linum grandiflorum]